MKRCFCSHIFYKISLLLSFCLFYCVNDSAAQYYLSGGTPNSVKWREINGKYYRVIYPKGVDSLAQEYLWLLEKNRLAVNAGLQIAPRPIPVVINPFTVSSNGFVTWTPKRMELFTQLPDNGYPQIWKEQLVLHESRHVGQISQFTKHIYKPLYYLLGEQSTGLGVGLYGARWYFEGDAVVAETALSNTGRGRTASFMEYYRASFLEKDFRTWDRWRYGSYKYYTPNIYAFGYLILSTQRYMIDNPVVSGEILNYTSEKFYNPDNLNCAFKKYGGRRYCDSYKFAESIMDSIWREDIAKRGRFTVCEPVLPMQDRRDDYFNSYRMCVADDNGNRYYFRESFKDGSDLVRIDSAGVESKLRMLPGGAVINEICCNNIFFTQYIQNPRWSNVGYSDLYRFRLEDNKIIRLSSRAAYSNPTINKIGEDMSGGKSSLSERKIAVIENLYGGGNRIAVLNAESGERIGVINPPKGSEISSISWGRGVLYASLIKDGGVGLYYVEPDDSVGLAWKEIIKPQYSTISRMKCAGDSLYFLCDADGVNNVYLVYNTESSKSADSSQHVGKGDGSFKFKRLTNSKYGVNSPYIANNSLYVSELSLRGYKPMRISLDSTDLYGKSSYYVQLTPDRILKTNYRYVVAEKIAEDVSNYLESNNFRTFSMADTLNAGFVKAVPKRYNKLLNLFRIHSWMPFYFNADKILDMSFSGVLKEIAPGVTVYSQNTLGTSVVMLGYSYRNQLNAGHARFTYSGLYPVFDVSVDINNDNRQIISVKEVKNDNSIDSSVPLVETSVMSYIPFNLSSNGWNRGLIPQIEWKFDNNIYYHYNYFTKKNDGYTYRNQLLFGLRYYQVENTPIAKLFPDRGFGITLKAASSINGGKNFGKTVAGYAYSYFPGFSKMHGIRFATGYQKQFNKEKLFMLSKLIPNPRGISRDIYANNYGIASLDYAIPIYLGDVNYKWFVYLQRLNITPFADYAACGISSLWSRNSDTKSYLSVGSDVTVDGIFFHITTPMRIGFRYAYNYTDNNKFKLSRNHFAVLFNITI